MENLEFILSLCGTTVGFLAMAATFVLKFAKSAKAKKCAEQTIEIANAVLPFIKQAESFNQYTGSEKKEFVMTKANQYAIEKKIPFNTELVSERVEDLIRLTKGVNMRDKDIAIEQINNTTINN